MTIHTQPTLLTPGRTPAPPASSPGPGLHAMDGSGGSSAASSAGTATITANDFLTLLVTELKNQDPTANTDPNEYINQLVQVNSLEQLIQINQNTGPSSASGQPSGSSPAAPGAAAAGARQLPAAAPQPSPRSSAGSPPVVAGNLAAPPPSDRAAGVAQALAPPRRATGAPPR